MAVQDYKINYKSDFVLNINGDAGWAVPFCIKFWTGMPSQAYFVGFDGVKYVNCKVGDTPTQLLVMFDDHHLPIGPLRMQIAYHTTIEEFPGSVFDEVTNARDVIVNIDGTDYQVMLDFTGEDAPELEFNLPAYANEAERIQNELQRQQNEAARIAAELQREQATAAAVQGAENVNAQLNGTTLTVTNRNGVSTSVNTKGEQGEQGPVGPQGEQGEQGETGISIVSFTPKSETSTTLIYTVTFSDGHTQDVPIPKGAKGDTGATGPQGPQGDTGVSIVSFTQTGSTTESLIYTVTFSDSTTQQVAIPKGAKGDTGPQGPVGPQGPQGPMGDVAVITPEQQAAFTMYSTTGQNTNGPMTQKAVTDALGNIAASGVSYDNSQSGLAADNVQEALGEIQENTGIVKLMDLTFCQPQNFNLENNVTKWSPSSTYRCFVIPRCLFGDRLYLLPLTYKLSYAFLQYCNLRSNTTVHFAGGMTHADTISVGSSKWVDIPNDCNCIYFYLSLYDIANINTLYSVYSVSKVKDDVETLIEPHWDTKEFNEAKASIMPSGYNSNTGIYENVYDPAVTYTRAISTIPFKLEKGEWIKITMDSSVKAFVMSIGDNNYYYGNDTGGPQTGGTIIAQGDGNKKVVWTAFANDANILTADDVISHISIVKGYDYRYEPTKVSVSERYNTTIQSDLVGNLALCSWAVYDGQGVPCPIPFQTPWNNRCGSASIEWIEDDILVSFPNTILSCCYDMGLDKIYKGRASLVVDKPYIVKGGRYIILWFKKADDSVISSLSDFVAQISVTNISAEDTVKGLVENNILNAFNDTSGRKVFGIARSNNHPHEHLSIYTQMDFFNDYYQLSSLQSSPYNKEKGYILHLTGSTDGNICPIDGIGQYPMTLPSMGHENDAFIDGDEMWVADGNALGSAGFTDIYRYLFSANTATKYTLSISSSTGATMVVGGICKYSDTELLIAAYDYRGDYNNEGDELRIYKMNKSTMAVELLFTTQWDGWFVQGMTYINGFAYIAANMIPNGSTYTGINIWKIDTLGTPSHVETMQLFGDFEPEGMDSYSLNGIYYLLMGIGKYSTIDQLTRMVAF